MAASRPPTPSLNALERQGLPLGLANWLTILRILLVPVFVSLMVCRRVRGALAVFLLAAVTDALDGYVARTHGRKTRLGAFLDVRDADLPGLLPFLNSLTAQNRRVTKPKRRLNHD